MVPILASERAVVLNEFKRLYGETVDEKLHLFEVNDEFVLQARFANDNLERVSVKPKYYFEKTHPEWKEPSSSPLFSNEKFRLFVASINKIKPLGKLSNRNVIAFVTNSTSWMSEYYSDAYLTYGSWGDEGIRSLDVAYFQKIIGKVLGKSELTKKGSELDPKSEKIYTVTLELQVQMHNWNIIYGTGRYYVRASDYRSMKKGKVYTLDGVSMD
jgi:hypothetical protein